MAGASRGVAVRTRPMAPSWFRTSKSISAAAIGLAQFAFGVGRLERLPFVVEVFAARHGQLHFCTPFFEVHPERHQREPLVGRLAGELLDLTLMQQELARSLRLVVEVVGL